MYAEPLDAVPETVGGGDPPPEPPPLQPDSMRTPASTVADTFAAQHKSKDRYLRILDMVFSPFAF